MQTAAIDSSSRAPAPAGATSFAAILSSMASPPPPDPRWSVDELADDVATISYEQALRNHGRSRSEGRCSESHQASVVTPAAGIPEREAVSNPKALKTASITVRFSPPECAQLRTRAAEADLTVSAYLRSCALEVEALRAQVKDALAQLRDAKAVSVQLSGLKPTRNNVLTMLQHLRQWIRSFRPARQSPRSGPKTVAPAVNLGYRLQV